MGEWNYNIYFHYPGVIQEELQDYNKIFAKRIVRVKSHFNYNV